MHTPESHSAIHNHELFNSGVHIPDTECMTGLGWSGCIHCTGVNCSIKKIVEFIYLTLNAGQARVRVDAYTGVPRFNIQRGVVHNAENY